MADAVNNFSVDYFVSTIKASGARSNLFSVTLTQPELASDHGIAFNTYASDKLDFLVEGNNAFICNICIDKAKEALEINNQKKYQNYF